MTSFPEFPANGHAFSADEVGQALAGLVARDAAGLPKQGTIAKPAIGAVAASWKVQVGRFVYVRNVAGGARFSGLSAAEQIDVTSAVGIPAGQSRIDRIVWDAVAGALVYIEGTAGTSPVAPSVGLHAPVVRVLVRAGDGMVVAGQVTSEVVDVGFAGESRPVATSTIVHYLGAGTIGALSVATNLAPVDYPRVLSVSNGDLGANLARFEVVSQVLAAGATNAVIGWTGAGVGSARVNFTATPVDQ